MRKSAIIFSAGDYLNSRNYPKPTLDLTGVKHDVAAIEMRLQQIGFDVTKRENAHRSEYFSTLQQGLDRCPSDAIHIVYFSGHGGHYNGRNYIFPSDFGALHDGGASLENSSISINDIIPIFRGKGRLILILDACRSAVSPSKGYFSDMAHSENVYIAYGTVFQNAAIGTSALSWFTEAICDEILTPNIEVDTMFTQVRRNLLTKHGAQLSVSVNGLLDSVVLNIQIDYEKADKDIYDFIEKRGDAYNLKFGYFQGEDLVFIDAAQYFGISLLDTYWKYTRVQNKLGIDMGIQVPMLNESESKLITFLNFTRGPKRFLFDSAHTWYYNGRQIRMGEIPPLPPSMQRLLPDQGKEFALDFSARRAGKDVIIETNIPDSCEIFAWDNKSKINKKYTISSGKIIIGDADEINEIVIDSTVFASNKDVSQVIGEKGRNLTGKFIEHHPIFGNQVKCKFRIE